MKNFISTLALGLSLLLTLLSSVVRADILKNDCYLNDRRPCQGCSNIELRYDTDARQYSMRAYNASSGAGMNDQKGITNLRITEYGADGSAGVKATTKTTSAILDDLEMNSGPGGIFAKASRMSLTIRGREGEFSLKVAGARLFTIKSECTGWIKQ